MVKCPRCGAKVKEPEKTWQLVAPLPDAEGRVTIVIMGSFRCPNCGHRWRGKVSTIKVGPEGEVEMEGKGGRRRKRKAGEKKEEKRGGPIIEIDLSDIEEEL